MLNNLILNGVDVDMNDIFYVGDSYIDYLTAINSNIPFLFIKHGYCKAEDIKRINTKYMFSDFRQLSEWYKNNKA